MVNTGGPFLSGVSMSCLHFNTDAQREQLQAARNSDEPIAQWLSPGATDSKIERIRRMAKDKNPKIRESAALAVHITEDVALILAGDKNVDVRICLARNENAPESILRVLSYDSQPIVRCWLVVNHSLPKDVRDMLAVDVNKKVRHLASLYKESIGE
jgi:hypothetical protein